MIMNKFIGILISVLLISFTLSNNLFAKSAPPGTGKSDVKANILIMLDRSGSMGWTAPATAPVTNPFDAVIDSSGNHWASEHNQSRVKKYSGGGKLLKQINCQMFIMVCIMLE